MKDNPFAIISPEELTAEQAYQLFVEMNSDYPEITRSGNTMIMGARGCGKSMLIRCSMPDVLMIKEGKAFEELPFLAFCVPIKKTSLNLQELRKLDDKHAPYMINEHFLSLYVIMYIFLSLSTVSFNNEMYKVDDYKAFYDKYYIRYLRASGFQGDIDVDYSTANSFFGSLYEHMFLMMCEFVPYLRSLFGSENADYSYNLPLLSFMRFIVPVIKKMCTLPGFPLKKPIFIFIDDADNLSEIQTQILNTWLACRTQPTISLKVSTQIGLYKTFLTSAGVLVESPHDYQEVNISYLYTTRADNFYYKAVDILERRLKIAQINIEPSAFFPTDNKQEERIKMEEDKIKAEYTTAGRGYRENDDVRRYAIPNYIRDLGGTRKSRMTYKYAGLDNIIHLSSGIIRYLLDAAAKMYDRAADELEKEKEKHKNKSENTSLEVQYIETNIQNEVMRSKADFYLFKELRKSNSQNNENPIAITDSPYNTSDKLGNLINAMGKTFHEILISDRAERKVFSIALSNIPDSELREVFELGVRLGFLHESYIGNKEGDGRTLLYILNRCFAPIFTLDPTGFQGYLFMTNKDLKKALNTGKQLRNILNTDAENDIRQLTIEDFLEDM